MMNGLLTGGKVSLRVVTKDCVFDKALREGFKNKIFSSVKNIIRKTNF